MPRHLQLDCLRGAAILGILLFNIVSFGLPSAAYLNPAWQGMPSRADTLIWLVLDVFGELKFLSLLALLFGAGIVWQLPRGMCWLRARMGWLVVFGLAHGLLLWEGDILLSWGLTGLLACRIISASRNATALLRCGIICYLVGCLVLVVYALLVGDSPGNDWLPSAAELSYERYLKLNGGWMAVSERLNQFDAKLLALVTQYGWELCGLILMGAALTRTGWLLGERSLNHYRTAALGLLLPGFAITTCGSLSQWLTGWDFRWSGFWLQIPRELASPLLALGYVALLHAIWPKIAALPLTCGLSLIGRMALSNYILQTLICLGGFSWLGGYQHYSRWQLTCWVPIIWLLNWSFSTLWSKYFSLGPLEWGWRWLTRQTANR